MKYDGQLSYLGRVTPLQQVMLSRRSYRKYQEGAVTPAQVAALTEVGEAFCARMGFAAPRIRLVTEPDARRHLISAACKGLVGKVNPWLPATKAPVMLVAECLTEAAPMLGDRHLALAQTAMAMQVVMLAAAAEGLGTCWMAGINGREVEKALELPDSRQVIALSTLGQPPAGLSLTTWDGIAYHLISKKRKPLQELIFDGAYGHPLAVPPPQATQPFQATQPGAAFIRSLVDQLPQSVTGPAPSEEALLALAGAARVAPSADNSQTWRFVTLPSTQAAGPLEIAAFGEPWRLTGVRREQPFFMIDVPIALTHMLLQATELGLKASLDLEVDEVALRAAAGVPEGFRAVGVLRVGQA